MDVSTRMELLENALAYAQTRAREAEEILAKYDARMDKAVQRAMHLVEVAKGEERSIRLRLEETEAVLRNAIARKAAAAAAEQEEEEVLRSTSNKPAVTSTPNIPHLEKTVQDLRVALWRAQENTKRRRRAVTELEDLVEPALRWRHDVGFGRGEEDLGEEEDEDESDEEEEDEEEEGEGGGRLRRGKKSTTTAGAAKSSTARKKRSGRAKRNENDDDDDDDDDEEEEEEEGTNLLDEQIARAAAAITAMEEGSVVMVEMESDSESMYSRSRLGASSAPPPPGFAMSSTSCFKLVAARIAAEEKAAFYAQRAEHAQELLGQAESLVAEAEARATQSEERVKEARRLLVKVAQRAAILLESNSEKDQRIDELVAALASRENKISELQKKLQLLIARSHPVTPATARSTSLSSSAAATGTGKSGNSNDNNNNRSATKKSNNSDESNDESIAEMTAEGSGFSFRWFFPSLAIFDEFYITKALISSVSTLLTLWANFVDLLAAALKGGRKGSGSRPGRRTRPRRSNAAIFSV